MGNDVTDPSNLTIIAMAMESPLHEWTTSSNTSLNTNTANQDEIAMNPIYCNVVDTPMTRLQENIGRDERACDVSTHVNAQQQDLVTIIIAGNARLNTDHGTCTALEEAKDLGVSPSRCETTEDSSDGTDSDEGRNASLGMSNDSQVVHNLDCCEMESSVREQLALMYT